MELKDILTRMMFLAVTVIEENKESIEEFKSLYREAVDVVYRGEQAQQESVMASLGRLKTDMTSFSMDELLGVIEKMLPDKHEYFVRVVNNPKLWEMFRDISAGFYCIGFKEQFLNEYETFPLCLADFDRVKYNPCKRPPKGCAYFTFGDLAEIAEDLIKHNGRSELDD